MKKIFARDGLTLSAGTAQQLLLGQQGKLVVLQGQLWITIDGQPQDHWLAPQQTLFLQARDRITVEATSADAVLMLLPVKSGAGEALKKWSMALPFVNQFFRHAPQNANASDVTSDFFRQWTARQCRAGAG